MIYAWTIFAPFPQINSMKEKITIVHKYVIFSVKELIFYQTLK